MDILSKISIKNLTMNKKRTISTMIGIILSVALICAVSTMFTSFKETLVQSTITDTGYWHLGVSDIEDSEIELLENSKYINKVNRVKVNGYSFLKGSQNEYKPYLKVVSMSKDTFKDLSMNLLEGRVPENSNEIVISSHILSNAKVKLEIGDTIELEVGDRITQDGYKLYPSNYYLHEDGFSEKLVNKKKMQFTIVGIISRPNDELEPYSDPGYTGITTNLDVGENYVYASLNNPVNYKKSVPKIFGFKDYNEFIDRNELNCKYDIDLNSELLRWEAFAFSDSTVSTLIAVVAVVIFIILFTSIFCIRNSFAIATTEKKKMFGMLLSVGATKKQIKCSVIFEGLILGIIAIPIGILCGIFAVYILIAIINEILIGNVLNMQEFKLKVTLIPIIMSVLLGFATILLSALSPAKKASKVSPIESLRSTEDIKISSKKLKTPSVISKLFGIGGVLAYKNLKRSKKKYRTTVISLAVSIFVFISMNSFITNAFDFTDRYYKEYDYNLTVGNLESISKEDIDSIISLDNIENYSIIYYVKGRYLTISDKSKLEINKYTGEDDVVAYPQIVILNSKDYMEYAKKVGISHSKTQKGAILVDDFEVYDNDSKVTKTMRRYKYKTGDVISATLGDESFNLEIASVTKVRPRGLENQYYMDGLIVLNKDYYEDKMDVIAEDLIIKSSSPDKLAEDIEKLKLSVQVHNLYEDIQASNAMRLVISIFLYGFIAVITLIGITNIFNTITSNMELRQKEFATLKSIGMTKREFNRMINLETIFYSTKSLIYGIILGLLGTFAIYKAFATKVEAGLYIPYIPILISVIFVFILVFVIMKYSMSKINKQNIIDTIRNENI